MSTGELVPLHDRCSIGRDPDNTVLLEHPTVSRWHAVIVRASWSQYCLMDLGTKNGTYVNGARLSGPGPVPLRDGDLITIEQDTLKFHSKIVRSRRKKSPIASTVQRDDPENAIDEDLFVPVTHGIVVLRGDHSVDAFSPSARLMISQYLNESIQKNGGLPTAVGKWLQLHRAEIQEGIEAPASVPPLEEKHGERLLAIHFESSMDGSSAFLLLIEKEPLFTLEKLKREFAPRQGLTDRQAEVTYYTALGKDNEEISILLACAHRTVGKHLERIYERVGADNRKALTTMVFEFFHR